MSKIVSAPVPLARLAWYRTLVVQTAPNSSGGSSGPATLPATGQQWPRPLL